MSDSVFPASRTAVDLTNLSSSNGFVIQGPTDNAGIGGILDGADVNGDGFADILIASLSNPTSGTGTVTVFTSPTADAGTGASICPGESVDLTASGSGGGGGYSYAWSTGGNTATISVNPATTTNYTVTVTDANGCTDDDIVTVRGADNPTATASGESVCSGEDFSLSSSVSGGNAPYTYSWSGPSGFTSTDADPFIAAGSGSYPGVGTHAYSVTVTDANGCTAIANTTATVAAPATLVLGSNSPICDGGAIELQATVSGGVATSYSWIGPNGFSATVEDPTILPTDPSFPGVGTFTYTLIIVDGNGCVVQESIDVVVTSGPEIVSAFASSSLSDGGVTEVRRDEAPVTKGERVVTSEVSRLSDLRVQFPSEVEFDVQPVSMMMMGDGPCECAHRWASGSHWNSDGSINGMYCSHCYENGQFKQTNISAAEMQQFVKGKLKEMGVPGFFTGFFTRGIPKLERWKRQ